MYERVITHIDVGSVLALQRVAPIRRRVHDVSHAADYERREGLRVSRRPPLDCFHISSTRIRVSIDSNASVARAGDSEWVNQWKLRLMAA